jgi:hypothetical protein
MCRALFLILPLAFAACSGLSREARIESKLERAGVKPHLARCLARRLDEKLSDDELARLGDAAKAARAADPDGGHHLSVGGLAGQLQSPGDRHLADVLSRAALGCAILG